MANTPLKNELFTLKREYEKLRTGKESLLKILDEAEISEIVYNSNAIENSTLTLKETEKILLDLEVSRHISFREAYEAKNLARVIEYVRETALHQEMTQQLLLDLHLMLLTNIRDEIAGRFRMKGEYVRVGPHVAPPPEKVVDNIEQLILDYASDQWTYFIDKIAQFHLNFEMIHPFNDGNGRMGRVMINYQLQRLGFPSIMIRDKEKKKYYQALRIYDFSQNTRIMEKIFGLALLESLHKRVTYLRGESIVTVADYARQTQKSVAALLNAAKRQTIPAFRERGVWKIGVE